MTRTAPSALARLLLAVGLSFSASHPVVAAGPDPGTQGAWRAFVQGWGDPDPEPNAPIWRDPEPQPNFPVWFDPEPEPVLVPRLTADNYWISYRTLDRIDARILSQGRAGAGRSLFESGSLGYRRHVAAFNTGHGTLLAAAEAGPRVGGTTIPRQIEVAGFDAQGQALQRRTIVLSTAAEPSWRPDLALSADPLRGPCCAVLAWSNRSAGRPGIEFERLDRSGKPIGTRVRIPAIPGLGQSRHPALAWQADSGDFLLVYETRADIRARMVGALGGLGSEWVVTRKSAASTVDELTRSRPAVAYSRALNAFLITWHDRDSLGARVVRATTVDEQGRAPAQPWVIKPCCGANPEPDPSPIDAIRLAAHADGFVLVMVARAGTNPGADIASYRLQMTHRFGSIANLRWLEPARAVHRSTPALSAIEGSNDVAVTFLDGLNLLAARHSP